MENLTDDILKAIRPIILKKVTEAYSGNGGSLSSERPQKRKQTVDFSKNPVCVLVTGYTPKSYALFGDFRRRYQTFKDEVMMAKKEMFLASSKLQFGFGWTFKGSDCAKVEKLLKTHKVEYRKISLEEYEKEVFKDAPEDSDDETPAPKKKIMSSEEEEEKPTKRIMSSSRASSSREPKRRTSSDDEEEETRSSSRIIKNTETKRKRPVSSDNEDDEPPKKSIMSSTKKSSGTEKSSSAKSTQERSSSSKKIMSSEDSTPVKKVIKKKGQPDLTLIQNEWGNNEEKDTSIVFTKLPIGKEGRDLLVAVGYQDVEEPQENKGMSSLLPLTTDLISQCEKNNWKYLDNDMIGKIDDKEIRKELRGIMNKAPEEEEESEAEVEEMSEEEEEEDEE